LRNETKENFSRKFKAIKNKRKIGTVKIKNPIILKNINTTSPTNPGSGVE
jgi:hypothetical protein